MTKKSTNTAQSDRGPEPNHLAKNKAKTRVEMLYCVRDLLQRCSPFVPYLHTPLLCFFNIESITKTQPFQLQQQTLLQL